MITCVSFSKYVYFRTSHYILWKFVVVAVDPSENVYVTGFVNSAIDGQTYFGGTSDMVLLKYNKEGVKQWTKLVGSSASDSGWTGMIEIATSSAVDIFGFALQLSSACERFV